MIAGRVLSNWYPIEEGIQLHGATYDTTEHFWQAVKYHPDVAVGQLKELIAQLEARNWIDWFARLDGDPKLYLPNAYAVEFLRHNLTPDRLWWFLTELDKYGLQDSDHVKSAATRNGAVSFQWLSGESIVGRFGGCVAPGLCVFAARRSATGKISRSAFRCCLP